MVNFAIRPNKCQSRGLSGESFSDHFSCLLFDFSSRSAINFIDLNSHLIAFQFDRISLSLIALRFKFNLPTHKHTPVHADTYTRTLPKNTIE